MSIAFPAIRWAGYAMMGIGAVPITIWVVRWLIAHVLGRMQYDPIGPDSGTVEFGKIAITGFTPTYWTSGRHTQATMYFSFYVRNGTDKLISTCRLMLHAMNGFVKDWVIPVNGHNVFQLRCGERLDFNLFSIPIVKGAERRVAPITKAFLIYFDEKPKELRIPLDTANTFSLSIVSDETELAHLTVKLFVDEHGRCYLSECTT